MGCPRWNGETQRGKGIGPQINQIEQMASQGRFFVSQNGQKCSKKFDMAVEEMAQKILDMHYLHYLHFERRKCKSATF